jgi:K+-transporting ATPase ATPase C chain
MKQYLLPSIRLSLVLLVLTCVIYPLAIAGLARLAPGHGDGVTLQSKGRTVGYQLIGQSFTSDNYFNGRPSAVQYNAAGSGGSNKGPSNPDYLAAVQARIDTFLVHNPGVSRQEIPVELVTASGSGLDPDISPAAAQIQVGRIAHARQLDTPALLNLVNAHTRQPLLGPAVVNVLELNIALDQLQ